MLRQLDIEENDPDITQSEKKKLDEYRRTVIKQEILKMLGLESPPNASNIPKIPKEMIKSVLHQTRHHRKGGRKNLDVAGKQMIVIAEPEFSLNLKDSEPQSFRFNANVKHNSVSSVILVLRRNPQILTKRILKKHRLFIARILGYPNKLSRLIGHPKIKETNKNWINLDITSILKSKGIHGMIRNISIEIICEECGGENGFVNSKKRRPFLIFNVGKVTKTRKRRSVANCSQTDCCIVDYNISTKLLGFDFVVAPNVFQLNFCKGNCITPPLILAFHDRIGLVKNPTKKMVKKSNCCMISKFKTLSILIDGGNNSIIKKDIPNVTATHCTCS
ncbi:growth/differentiation factor 8-like [Dendronephthya gigantea]|nr:growth/differentiation factor 8-like [Dendronephthya gigantea]